MEQNSSSFSDSKFDRVMTPEQFNQIVEAIISGKYSWACLLILRFAGYNPLHYIPYRTYNRLMKDNRVQITSQKVLANSTVKRNSSRKSQSRGKFSRQLEDLSYLEDINDHSTRVIGGNGGSSVFSNFCG